MLQYMLYNVSQLSAEKFIQFIFKFFWVRQFVIHCEVRCQKFKNLIIYVSKTVEDNKKIPIDQSSGVLKGTVS